jgi:hypothetical protein
MLKIETLLNHYFYPSWPCWIESWKVMLRCSTGIFHTTENVGYKFCFLPKRFFGPYKKKFTIYFYHCSSHPEIFISKKYHLQVFTVQILVECFPVIPMSCKKMLKYSLSIGKTKTLSFKHKFMSTGNTALFCRKWAFSAENELFLQKIAYFPADSQRFRKF